MSQRVCSTEYLYHYFFQPSQETIDSVLQQGLRPLSDFPDSPRWQRIQAAQPGFFEMIYRLLAEPYTKQPYTNSGVFVTPIDFYRLPDTYLIDKPRVRIPLARFQPEWSFLTYEFEEERVGLPLTAEHLETTAQLWTAAQVRKWFGVDKTKVFYYVPQAVTYQPGGVPVEVEDIEYPA